MSNNFKFVLNSEGVKSILQSQEMINVMKNCATNGVRQVASIDDYEIGQYIGKNRANVSISARTEKGEKDNLNNNILLKALGSSKG